MRKLSSLILSLVLSVSLSAQKSPHGDSFIANCDDCHKTDGWKVDLKTISFDHNGTKFPLVGQHKAVNCKQCHTSLEFAKAQTECNSCHTDIHQQTVGLDCARCHTPNSWVVTNITQLHQQSRFPLIGPHVTADCKACHINLMPGAASSGTASLLRFDPLGIECYDCHKNNYIAATSPNHVQANYSTNCTDCHSMNAFSWKGAGINHNFFPLVDGHALDDCSKCHTNGFVNTSPVCASCHTSKYSQTTNPNHTAIGISTDCATCHTLAPGWNPATFPTHNNYYVLAGAHVSTTCSDCHKGNYNNIPTTCVGCHQNNYNQSTNPNHVAAQFPTTCADCHSQIAWKPATFNHDGQFFPIYSGKHQGTWTNCNECHTTTNNYALYSCIDCHDHNKTDMDNKHQGVGGYQYNSPACFACHPTGNSQGSFDHAGAGFPLSSGHASVNCSQCHTSGFVNTSPVCASCHTNKYSQTTNPNHAAIGISTDCATCHTLTPGWNPATFPTHNNYYVLEGAHVPIANECATCHNGNYVNSPNTCYGCHAEKYNQTTNPNHISSQFGTTCETCHSQSAWSPSNFDHNITYPLTGAHATIANNCIQCHTNGYTNTPNTCAGCHQSKYNQTTNPNHAAIGISNDCATCHTTNPGWNPATFPTHNSYYLLAGAHVSTPCADCHNGNYNTTPNTCAGCHINKYNQTTNPNHTAAQFPTTCADCHSQTAWTPATFNHDGQYFPIYSGKHNGQWNTCADCHTNPSNYAVYTCTTSCHPQSSTNNQHQGVGGYQYVSSACLACHPTGTAGGSFNHNTSPFPLTGGHAGVDCSSCHANGYGTTSTVCASCHTPNYNQTNNPNHAAIGISTDCAACHTTNPGWNPATFPTHNNYYVLAGAHVAIANQCVDCHNGNYNSTPNTCAGCHMTNYNQTTNPNHVAAQFPTTCADCHTQTAWTPSTFNHDGQYFPIYSGTHNNQWNTCADCHTNPSNFAVFTCTTSCHSQSSTNNQHQGVGGYVYSSNECYACHPNGTAGGAFNHNTSPFPLTGGHANVVCASCHANGYNNTSTVCVSCHTNNYNQTTNPNHIAINISNECATCHTTNPGWAPATFPIHNNYYVLAGAHVAIANQCVDCHNGNYNSTPNTCSGCHMNNYNQTTNPNHVAQQFPTTCQTCHSQTAWTPSTFDHNTVYPLTGGHATIAGNCTLCHANGYTNTPNTCVGCHQSNYNQTTNPNHAAINIPNSCATCHTTNPGWAPATFPIHNNYYVLAGAHISLPCSDCHNGNYNSTPNTCAGCHMTNYNQTTNPNHAAAQFPTTCADCHTQTAWTPSTFNHDGQYFPIYSGTHHNQWNTCADCHTNPSNFAVFTCTTSCHPQSSTNSHHQGVSGYSYNSAACYNCHPTGNAGGDKLNKSLLKSN